MGARHLRSMAWLAAATALAGAGPAFAQSGLSATAATGADMSISAPQSLGITQTLSFTVLPTTVNTGLVITSSAAGGVNANVVLTGAQTASIAVPATFEVTRVGGTETITVRTVGPVTNVGEGGGATQVSGVANGSFFNNPVSVVGNLDNGVLSFSVGGAVTLASNLAPGQYQGVLTVVAQYN